MKKIFYIFLLFVISYILISCSKEEYFITYALDGGECNELVYSFFEDDNVKLPTPLKENFEFIGWYENDILIDKISESRNYYLTAKWERNKYFVSYNLDGGNCDELVNSFNKNEFINLPIPLKENYKFIGWYEGENHITEINENRDYDLTAKWERDLFYITYNLDGGVCDNLIYSFKGGENIILSEPTRKNYRFVGWYEGENHITEINENRDYDLVAKWEELVILYLEAHQGDIFEIREYKGYGSLIEVRLGKNYYRGHLEDMMSYGYSAERYGYSYKIDDPSEYEEFYIFSFSTSNIFYNQFDFLNVVNCELKLSLYLTSSKENVEYKCDGFIDNVLTMNYDPYEFIDIYTGAVDHWHYTSSSFTTPTDFIYLYRNSSSSYPEGMPLELYYKHKEFDFISNTLMMDHDLFDKNKFKNELKEYNVECNDNVYNLYDLLMSGYGSGQKISGLKVYSGIVIEITLENENIDPIYLSLYTDFLTLPQILN